MVLLGDLPHLLGQSLLRTNGILWLGFPGSSVGKESACNAGDPGSISGSGSFPGAGIPTPVSWASLVAQLVKNPPAIWETWVQSLGWEDPLEEGMAAHSSFLPLESIWTEWQGTVHGVSKSQDATEHLKHGLGSHVHHCCLGGP